MRFENMASSSQLVRFCFLLPDMLFFAAVVTAAVWFAKRRDEREERDRKRAIKAAVARITADGKVEGPKGPYVPHRRWNVGLGATTPHETKPDVHGGPYGNPVP